MIFIIVLYCFSFFLQPVALAQMREPISQKCKNFLWLGISQIEPQNELPPRPFAPSDISP